MLVKMIFFIYLMENDTFISGFWSIPVFDLSNDMRLVTNRVSMSLASSFLPLMEIVFVNPAGIKCSSLPSQNGCLKISCQLKRFATFFSRRPLSKLRNSVDGLVESLFPFRTENFEFIGYTETAVRVNSCFTFGVRQVLVNYILDQLFHIFRKKWRVACNMWCKAFFGTSQTNC
jgi:hypothetical protein